MNTDPDPWAGPPGSLWRNANLDPRLFGERELLVQLQAKELKLTNAIQAGRIYALARDHYTFIRQQKLEKALKRQELTSPALVKHGVARRARA